METPDVERFIVDEMDSVPHLEALLLLWRSAPRQYTARELSEQLYVTQARAMMIADDLHRRGLVEREARVDGAYFFDTRSEERNRLMEAVDSTYRRELIRISGLIHSKASPGIRAFADAFRFRKDRS